MNLDNLVPYTHPSAAWSNHNSNIALFWDNENKSGLQCLQAVIGWGGSPITDSLLSWHVEEDDKSLDLDFKSRNFRPDKIIEASENDNLKLIAISAFPARNSVAIEFKLENKAITSRRLNVIFDFPGKGVAPDWQGSFPVENPKDIWATFLHRKPANHFVQIDDEAEGSWSTLFQHSEHGRNSTWVKSFVAGMPQTTLELVCLSNLSDRLVELNAGSTASFTVLMSFGLTRGRAKQVRKKGQQLLKKKWSSVNETNRIEDLIANTPSLPSKYAGKEIFQRMYAHAITGLDSLFIKGEGGYTGDRCVPYTTKYWLAIAFFWDTAYSCYGACEFNTDLCQDAITCFVDNVSPRGSMPGTLCDTHRAGEGQAPIMTLAAWKVYCKSKDVAWLAKVYPILGGYYRFWKKYHSSTRGLCLWYNAGQIGDNDPRFDPVYNREMGNEPISGMESPDLCAFQIVQMKCLVKMAQELGLKFEAREWQDEATSLGKLIVDTMYFSEDTMFYDVAIGTHEKFSGTKNPNMFLPLWAEVPLEDEEIKKIIENHMLNPDEFYRELPFPSVSFDHPSYDPDQYWRGRIWPHFVYWMIQILWRYGYHQQAEETADRILAMYQKWPWFHENYNSKTGESWNREKMIGFPEYNWAHATVIQLLLERYKEPVIS